MTLIENIERGVREFPERIAYIFQGMEATYGQLYQQAKNTAAYLAEKGIGKGDHVALLLGNSPHFLISYYGVLLTGAAVVPINPIYTPKEIMYILHNSQSKVAIAAAPLLPAFEGIKQMLPDLHEVVLVGGDSEHKWTTPFEKIAAHSSEGWQRPEIDGDDLAVILYTSGTTGQPKGAMLTQRNLASNAEAIAEYLGVTEADTFVTVLPMFHVFCMTVCMNAPIAIGATMLILPKFSPTEVVQAIREHKATLFVGVPTMYNFIMQTPGVSPEDLASLRICISGGASLPVALLHNFEKKFGKVISEGYGLSEASPVTAFNPVHGVRKPGSIGVDIPGVENKIVDAEGEELERGQVGELIVRGPNVMKGYLNMPEETSRTIQGGWLYTGDMAYMDEDGYIFIVDRKKDMIIVGGYNVYPREVEEVLYEHPQVIEAAVIGVPDENLGEAVQAYVVARDESLTEEELKAHCRTELAKYKVPSKIVFLDELPKNTTGKILRRTLRDMVLK
ncbi:fatty acid--CoA ligase family protein [Aneurinibacillus danicus]|jgi:long-chain acyl-CoA synthetase|uniref:Long-chain-fatty-acid--CoA ligase n=1 Tax=Aneurinibacillus danicus TaxID=267746 RepID=A0A511V6F0_9BACL|nr:fatty acid--CoA ligase family protein [Aneurinibacillus danicus]GEN34339.1 long-chain-fatty-acid--CoA ligase [Aneurinibacillus danicus]